jgi:pimeloyl-ACP methyl ester carboxylesterase
VAQHLALASSSSWRAELQDALARFGGPVRIITGTDDPLTPEAIERVSSDPNVELASISDAGHHPQLTHVGALVDMLLRPTRGQRVADSSAALEAPRSTVR